MDILKNYTPWQSIITNTFKVSKTAIKNKLNVWKKIETSWGNSLTPGGINSNGTGSPTDSIGVFFEHGGSHLKDIKKADKKKSELTKNKKLNSPKKSILQTKTLVGGQKKPGDETGSNNKNITQIQKKLIKKKIKSWRRY